MEVFQKRSIFRNWNDFYQAQGVLVCDCMKCKHRSFIYATELYRKLNYQKVDNKPFKCGKCGNPHVVTNTYRPAFIK